MSQSICSKGRVKISEPTASIERNGAIEKVGPSVLALKGAAQKSLEGSVALSWYLAQVHRTAKCFPTHTQHPKSTRKATNECTCYKSPFGGGSGPPSYPLRWIRRWNYLENCHFANPDHGQGAFASSWRAGSGRTRFFIPLVSC